MRSLAVFFGGLLLASVTQAVEIPIAYERYPHTRKLDQAVGTLDIQIEESVLVVRVWFLDTEAHQLRTALGPGFNTEHAQRIVTRTIRNPGVVRHLSCEIKRTLPTPP